ncbi:MAG: tRNA pseudouridine(38-40) synthase TruA [Gemmatimonadetes bacterium]|nr:tRNA pseudouridine(38-40) synthase TruA [Gemmatimonadota bacterium]
MSRFRLTIEYAGTRYSGWQIQANARTVQGEIDRAIRTATRQRDFELYGSGRTDAGVHALAQIAHLEIATTWPPDTLRQRVNDELPSDINLLDVSGAPRRFHARHDAVARSYVYQIARRRTAFAKAYVWWVREGLDLARMRDTAALFTGLKDFHAFTADEPEEKSTKVLVEPIEIAEAGDLVLIRVTGSHFLWKMVRRLVGVMVEAGRGGLTREEARGLLEGPSTQPARLTAPASGLFLEHVFYDGEGRDRPLRPAVPVQALQ